MLNETSKIKTYKYHSLFLPRCSSFLNKRINNENDNNIYIRKRNESIQLDNKIKYSFNENENNTNNINNTNINLNKTVKELSPNKKTFPLLLSKEEQRIKNYNRMKRYRVKLIKASPKTIHKKDNVYQLFKENGFQFLYPQEKNNDDNINNINKRLTYRNKNYPKRKLRISLSTQNLKDLQYKLVSPRSNSNNLKIYQKKDDNIYKPSFKMYMKLQSLADIKFRPILGDSSSDLVNFLKKIELVRKEVINNCIDEINNVENRFNIERPKEDFKFKTKMQGLYPHKWKNIFSLKDYQDIFADNLRGRISSKNYDIMEKNFRDIFFMCFSSGGYK